MLVTPELLDKIIVGVGGFLVAGVVGILTFLVKEYLSAHKEKASSAAAELKAVAKELSDFRVSVVNVVNALKLDLQKFDRKWSEEHIRDSAKFDSLSKQVSDYNKDVSKLEGRLEEHMGLLANQISTNKAINDKFVRVFEYIEAKERTIDSTKRQASV